MKRALGLIIWLFWALAAAAQDSPRPIARPVSEPLRPVARPVVAPAPQTIAQDTVPLWTAHSAISLRIRQAFVTPAMRPRARDADAVPLAMRPPIPLPDVIFSPNFAGMPPLPDLVAGDFGLGREAIITSLRPLIRPASIERAAEERRLARLRGQVCGNPNIQGEAIGRVSGAGACGIDSAVRVKSVSGVQLSPNATIDCPTARALNEWVNKGVFPAVGGEGGGVASLRVVSHYSCRTRNSQPGARLSEHAFGRAVDIASIGLKDGSRMTLLTGWNSSADGAQWRQMWRAACGIFGTVLGPEANRFHLDHFHFDTARYRSGTFCR